MNDGTSTVGARRSTLPAPSAPGPRSAATVGRIAVVHVTTVQDSLQGHLTGQLSFLRRSGFAIHVVTSPGRLLEEFGEREGVRVHAVPMARAITPVRDLVAIVRLWRLFRRIRPQIVHSHTPKGGLVGMIAATLAGIRARIYHVRGFPFVTATGLRRVLLRTTERTSCLLAHRVLAVSHSMRDIAVAERICAAEKIAVPARGSGNGVDAAERFTPQPATVRDAARARCGIPRDAVVIGFVGRIARDKGILELTAAWRIVRESDPRLHLLVVGGNELERRLEARIAPLHDDPRVHFTGQDFDTPRLYATMDVVALPTYREGFPIVALEAAAMALPIVATSVPGCVDAVQDRETGTLVPPRDAGALAAALMRYVRDAALRADHGGAARRRVLADFRPELVWEAIEAEYRRLLQARHG